MSLTSWLRKKQELKSKLYPKKDFAKLCDFRQLIAVSKDEELTDEEDKDAELDDKELAEKYP